MDSASSPKSESKFDHSYEDESFATAEGTIGADTRSSPIVWRRQESIFLAESSTSSEDIQTICTESCETTPVTTENESANRITEEADYSDEFESFADLSEGVFTVQDKDGSGTKEDEVRANFLSKKFAILTSSQTRSKTQTNTGDFVTRPAATQVKTDAQRRNDKKVDGHKCQEINFCARKLEIVEGDVKKTGKGHAERRMMATAKGIPHGGDKPIGGNRRKIEDLMIENLMNKAEKLKELDFHNPKHCTNCRKMKASVASKTFLKRKVEIAKRAEFEERLELHLYHKDSATLLAEIVNSCTKPSDSPSEVWEKVLCKGRKTQ